MGRALKQVEAMPDAQAGLLLPGDALDGDASAEANAPDTDRLL